MQKIKRLLTIDFPPGQSAFLSGPRKTGRSTYLKERRSVTVRRITKTFLVGALCMAPILASYGISAASDVNISVTIAIGGVACGVYFFVAYTAGYNPDWKTFQPETALLNRGPDGWRVGYPHLKFIEDGCSSSAPYVDVMRVVF
jgi:hypothetical protein